MRPSTTTTTVDSFLVLLMIVIWNPNLRSQNVLKLHLKKFCCQQVRIIMI